MFLKKKPLHPELEREYRALIKGVNALARETDPERLNARPSVDSWSAAECIDHLNATARLYLGPLDEAIAAAREEGLRGDRRDGRTLLGRVIAWAMEPPARIKTKTYDRLEPAPDHDPGELASEFEALHGALITQMLGAGDLDRKRVKVRSLLDSRLKLSLDDWYAFIGAHARRHLWQADRALEQI